MAELPESVLRAVCCAQPCPSPTDCIALGGLIRRQAVAAIRALAEAEPTREMLAEGWSAWRAVGRIKVRQYGAIAPRNDDDYLAAAFRAMLLAALEPSDG